MYAQRLNSVCTFVRRLIPALALAGLTAAATGCSTAQHEDLSNCLATLHASHNNAEAIGSLDPDASATPADRYRGATPDEASLVNVSVSRHPVR
jgi:hypothetical protein